MISAQGGDVDAPLPVAQHVEEVRAAQDGRRHRSMRWAWGRGVRRSAPDAPARGGRAGAAGVEIAAHVGDTVRAGDVLARLHTDTPGRIARALEAIDGSWSLATPGTAAPERRIVLDRIV